MSPTAGHRGLHGQAAGSRPARLTPRPSTGDALLDESLRLADELRAAGLKPKGYSLGSPYGGHLPGRGPGRCAPQGPSCPRCGEPGDIAPDGLWHCSVCGSGLLLPD